MKTILAIIIACTLTSCNLTVAPDGSRHWSFNGEIAKAIIVHATK
jgi:hypothetical protein